MEITLPPDLKKQVEQEFASGRYQSRDELIEQAVRHFLDERRQGQQRLDALRRIGQAVDQAGLYERALIPDENDGDAARRPGCLRPRQLRPLRYPVAARRASAAL
jgi:Arc/MetJ-type ribon-helix-helix transcriptional regulator